MATTAPLRYDTRYFAKGAHYDSPYDAPSKTFTTWDAAREWAEQHQAETGDLIIVDKYIEEFETVNDEIYGTVTISDWAETDFYGELFQGSWMLEGDDGEEVH